MKTVNPERINPLVSVCCTTYNLESFVSKTIASILSQQAKFPFELIIHDDASTDGTCAIIKSYAAKYPRLINPIFQDKNIYNNHEGGLGHIFKNHILSETQGKYIAICDGDDYWTDPYKLQKQVDYLEKMDQCSACFTNSTVLNEFLNKVSKFIKDLNPGFVPEDKMILRGGSVYPTSTLVFKKEKFITSIFFDYFDEFSKYHEYDTLFIYCLLLNGKIGYLDDDTSVYRQWNGGLYSSIMHNPEKTAAVKMNEIKGTKKLIEIVDRKRKKLFKRKVSIDLLHVLRNKPGIEKYKYFLNLNIKEAAKFFTNSG